MEESINQANATMAAAHAKAAGDSTGQGSKGNKPKWCSNCNVQDHDKDNCYAKGGGKADNPPDWWKEKMAKAKGKSANAADKESDDKDKDNYTIMAVNNEYENDDDTPNLVLVITSGHDHDAYTVSKSASTIVDSGASSHFSPDKNKFINYRKIMTEPVKATDGGFFSATGKGDLKIKLPNCPGHKPVTIMLQGVYYSPTIAFTLISVSCLDR